MSFLLLGVGQKGAPAAIVMVRDPIRDVALDPLRDAFNQIIAANPFITDPTLVGETMAVQNTYANTAPTDASEFGHWDAGADDYRNATGADARQFFSCGTGAALPVASYQGQEFNLVGHVTLPSGHYLWTGAAWVIQLAF